MIKKMFFLLFLFCIFTILVNVKVNGEIIIELPKEYVQVGIGRDDLIIEDNLTVTSGYVNWDLEGNYIITYIDRLDNIYKKEFVIIESVDNQYLLNEGKEHKISFSNISEIVDVFYINDVSYYVVSNYQEEDPTAPDQEKICITYFENDCFKWEYRYYKYGRYNYGYLHDNNLIVTGIVYNADNNYINTIVIFEITKDRQIIKTREISSDKSCYCHGMYLYENNIYLVTTTSGNKFDYSKYKQDYDNRLVILKLDYSTFKIVDGVANEQLSNFYVVGTSFYNMRIAINIGYKTNITVNNVIMTNCIYEYNDNLEFINNYYYNGQYKDYIGFQLTNKDVCIYAIDNWNNNKCVNIQYLNYGVDIKNIYLELENQYSINDVKVISINENDIYFCLKNRELNNNQFIGFAKVNSINGVKYFSKTPEQISILSSKISNGYIINTYKKNNKIYYKSFNLIEILTKNNNENDIIISKKSVIVNTISTEKYQYINNTNENIFGMYINKNRLIDHFGVKYYLCDITNIPLKTNVESDEVYQIGYKLSFNGYGKLNGIEIDDGFIVNDIGKYLLEIDGENVEKMVISFEISNLSTTHIPREKVEFEVLKPSFIYGTKEDNSYVETRCDFKVKENYDNIVPLVISIISFGILSLILMRKKI